MSGLIGTLLYNAPWLVAWYRRRNGQPIIGTVVQIALFDIFLGWTIVGWFTALSMALNVNWVAPVAIRLAKFLAASGFAGSAAAQPGSAGGSGSTCYVCHGRGTVTKTGLEMSAMDAQNTMNQQNQLTREVPCSACGGSGKRLY